MNSDNIGNFLPVGLHRLQEAHAINATSPSPRGEGEAVNEYFLSRGYLSSALAWREFMPRANYPNTNVSGVTLMSAIVFRLV